MQLELREKTYFDECATREMAQYLHAPKRTVRETLVYAARILAGPEAGLAGQLSARSERPKANWMSRFGLGLRRSHAGRFHRSRRGPELDHGRGHGNPATRFHLCIYEVRSDLSHRSCSLSLAIPGTGSAPLQPDGEPPLFGAGDDLLAVGPSRKSWVTISTRSPIN